MRETCKRLAKWAGFVAAVATKRLPTSNVLGVPPLHLAVVQGTGV